MLTDNILFKTIVDSNENIAPTHHYNKAKHITIVQGKQDYAHQNVTAGKKLGYTWLTAGTTLEDTMGTTEILTNYPFKALLES